uniref:G_PROTEIN_RECEP_F1_2 domain-containing protein n=1 Tax=Rhabditophanes sp. KR3021 TaxID=114890 RepID=A0AC35U4Q5_9BILA
MFDFYTTLNLIIFFLCLIPNLIAISLYNHFKMNGILNVAMISTFFIIINNYYLSFRFPYLDNIPVTFNQYCFCVWIFCTVYYSNFAIVAITIFVRYSSVITQTKLRNLIFMYVIGVGLISGSLIHMSFVGLDQNIDMYILYNQTEYTENPQSKSVSVLLDIRIFLYIGPIFVILCFCFFIIKHKTTMSKATRRLNHDFLNILFAQALAPVFLQFIPTGKLEYIILFIESTFRILFNNHIFG